MTDLARLVVRLEAETSKYQSALDASEKKLVRFEHASNHLADSLKGRLEGAIAAVVGPAALGLLLAHTVEQADRLNDLSKATGVSVEALSRLNFAARQSGTDLETLNAGLRKLNLSIAEAAGNAKSDAAIAFKAMGVSLRDATGNLRRGDVVLADVAERFSGYADGANKSALANAVFGKGFEPLIPLLNQGADGLKRLGEQADAAGATISTQTAQAADELLDRVRLLRTSLIDGLGARIAEDLLPNLNALAQIWTEDRARAEELDAMAVVLATTFRLIAAAAIVAVGTIQQVGLAIYNVNAAMLDFAHLDFSGGLSQLKEGFRSLNANADSDLKKLQALFAKNPLFGHEPGGHGVIRPVIEPPNVEALKAANTQIEKAAQAAATATKRLLEMDQNFKEQIATFDLTDAAATRYRVTLGSLSDDVLAAGKGGQALAAALIADSEAFDKLKRAKEVAAALVDVNAQINELKGNTAEAVLARFDQQNLELVKKLRLDGNAAGETELATLRKLISAQAAFNLLQQKAERIQADLAIAEERIQNSRLVGALTELDAAKQTSAVRDQAVQDLSAIYEQEKKISDTAGSQDLIDRTKAFGGAIGQLSGQVDLLGQRARATLEEDFGNFFDEAITNIHNLGGAFKHFLEDLAAQLIRFAAQNFAQRLLGAILPSSGGGGGGGFASIVSAVFGGGRAGGGDVEPGRAYKVNENTRRSEWFVPATRGVVRPASQMQGLTVQQHFAIEAPQGTVSRQTQQQIGAQAARALAIAQRRNG